MVPVVKGAGILILTLTAVYYSWYGQQWENKKHRTMKALYEMFLYIQKSIECYAMPLGEIFRNCSNPVLEETEFLPYWKRGELKDAVNTLKGLTPAVESALLHYAENAGSGYKDAELQLCHNVIAELETALNSQSEMIKNKNKLYRTMPFLFVLSVVLLFA